VFAALAALFYLGWLIYRALSAYSPVVKSQARTILFGAVVAFGPVVGWMLWAAIDRLIHTEKTVTGFNPYLLPFLVIFPVANGYVIMRFRLLRTDYWARQMFSFLTVLWCAYGSVVGVAHRLTNQ
jgi:hypothetical protein